MSDRVRIEKEKSPIFSIIMPAYNSQSTIEMALRSIRMQDMPKEDVEILVIDGGSSDKTIEIAKKYDVTILDNPQKLPEYAKRIGFASAHGKWIIMQDSDEVLTDTAQLRKRKEFFEKNTNVYCLVLDKYVPGENCGVACAYVNYVGDPFNYVIYHLSDSRIKSNKRKLKQETKEGNIYCFLENDLIPIGDGGTTTIDIIKAKELFGEDYFTQEFAVSAFYNMVLATQYVGCIPHDNVKHYSLATFRSYLRKLDFRVYTNLNGMNQAGYAVRAQKSAKLKRRKVYFVLYCLSVVLPIFDSIKMCIQYKRASLLLHFFYTYYIVYRIVIRFIKKVLHIPTFEIKYGK